MKTHLTTDLQRPKTFGLPRVLQSPFPYYLNDDRKNLVLVTAISGFVFFFMLLYTPFKSFEMELTPANVGIFAGVTFIVLWMSIIVLPKIFTITFDPTAWNVQK